jgi:L-threonylcarbamoyladenylate synthase
VPEKKIVPGKMLDAAVNTLKNGGVIAYPTEFCFGLGCDPQNASAVHRILQIKGRDVAQGLILVAADIAQIERYAVLPERPRKQQILDSWPGPNTWVLEARTQTAAWITGDHGSVAMRVSAHSVVRALCFAYGGAIVSTSANRSGSAAILSAAAVQTELGAEVDFIVPGALSENSDHRSASNIFDATTGKQLR